MPTLARLVESGASAAIDAPAVPGPAFWATVATGLPPARHGVFGPSEIRPDRGGVQPVGARAWRAAPLWQLLAAAGLSTACVGWPGTAPASAWPGYAVDDRFSQPAGCGDEDWPLPPDCIQPQRLRAPLRLLRVHPEELDDLSHPHRVALAADASIHAAATQIAEHEPWDFMAVHYRLPARDRTEETYRLLDAMLARLLALAGPDTGIIVASSGGVLVAAGTGIVPDTVVHGAAPADIAATVLAHFGLAQPESSGRALQGPGPHRAVELPPPPSSHAMQAEPSCPAEPVIAAAEHRALLHHAAALLAAGDHAGAADLLGPALDRAPEDADVLFLLGQCRFFLGDWEACLDLGRALAIVSPAQPWGEMMIGAALALGGDHTAAVPHLLRAAERAGDDPAAHLRLGAIALHLGESAGAQRHYQAALDIDPGMAEAQAGIGLALLACGETATAEARLRLSLGARFHAPALHHQLALLCAAQGRWTEAAAALRTALSQHPGLPEATNLLRQVEDEVARRLARDVQLATG